MSVSGGSRRTFSTSRWYSYLFGSSARNEVLWRLAVDFTLANLALVLGTVSYLFLFGQVSAETPLSTLSALVSQCYLEHSLLFGMFAIAFFSGTRLYRPLPGGRIGRRILDIGMACSIGGLTHLGAVVFSGTWPSRGIIVFSWGVLFGLVSASRLFRSYWVARFQVTSKTAPIRRSRIQDVLVVGGAGYIGSVLTRQLLDAGYRVRVLDLLLFGTDSLAEIASHPRLQIVKGDFRNVEDVVRSLRGMDAVVHLAAIVGDPACSVHEQTTIDVNYGAAKMIAQLSRAQGISRFIFASTCSVYGASDVVTDETSGLNPVSLYATTKIDAEKALLETADHVFQPTILRIATAYGWSHRPRFDLVANLLSAKAVADGEITIFNGEQWRPFVNTQDISRSMVMALEAPLEKVGAEVFNVGDESQNFTLGQLGQIVAEAVPGTVVQDVRNDEDPRNYCVNFDKIRDMLGFKASVTLQEGIQEIVEAARKGEVADWRDPIYSNVRHIEASGLKILTFGDEQPDIDELQATRRFLSKAA